VDAAKPISIAPPEFSELIPTIRSSLISIDRFKVSLNSDLHATYCRWLI
jgi:hypothetical protein